MDIGYYDYQELKAAVEASPTQENINALGEWFHLYGDQYWNGEEYNADNFFIYPVYEQIEEDEFKFIRYEMR